MLNINQLTQIAGENNLNIEVHYPQSSLKSWQKSWDGEWSATESHDLRIGIEAKDMMWSWFHSAVFHIEEIEEIQLWYTHTYSQKTGSRQCRRSTGRKIEALLKPAEKINDFEITKNILTERVESWANDLEQLNADLKVLPGSFHTKESIETITERMNEAQLELLEIEKITGSSITIQERITAAENDAEFQAVINTAEERQENGFKTTFHSHLIDVFWYGDLDTLAQKKEWALKICKHYNR